VKRFKLISDFLFSKTINNYFQMIVEEVEAFGGDVLKFAGDAVFCEWQATTSNPLESGDGYSLSATSQCSIEPWHGLGQRECVLTAATCGAKIVDKCSDFPVYDGSTLVATLNVHCGLGYGEVVGVHVGDRETRMEYLILGGPIEQVAAAMQRTRRGEVVASPDALYMLSEIANLDERVLLADLSEPQVIAYKKNMFFTRRDNEPVQSIRPVIQSDLLTKPREKLAQRCDAWGTPALTSLRKKMALYVHPVVVNDESVAKVYPGDKSRAQERHRSEAELREVYTVFIMPLITARLNGDDERDCRVLVLLNDIMLIMTRELSRFKGHLRQFIVDDKGKI
jgi:class 3 adenylate cyclase